MNPYETYQRQRTTSWTRIEMLLALYEGAIARLEEARSLLASGNAVGAAPALVRAQRIVAELLSGVDLSHGEVPSNFQRLYAFVLQAIASSEARQIDGALEVLRTLQEGLLEIRTEATQLERSGAIPPIDSGRALQAIA